MKKVLVLLMLFGLVIGLLAITGCGSDTTTVKTPEGEVSVNEDTGDFSVNTGEGDVSYNLSEEVPTEAELGAPIYPGAEYVEGSGMTSTATSAEGEIATAGADFTTSDSFEDVVDWYSGELGEPTYQTSEASMKEATWMVDMSEESYTMVIVTEDNGEVTITIGRMAGSMGE